MRLIRMGLLGSALLFGAIFGTGCTTPKYADTIRPSNEYCLHYSCSQVDGERMLQEALETADVEDAWIYRVRNGEGVWIDVGEMSSKKDVDVRTSTLENVLQNGDEITFYHIHLNVSPVPTEDVRNYVEDSCGKLELSYQEDAMKLCSDFLDYKEMMWHHTPSVLDLKFQKWLKECCNEIKINPSKLVCRYFVTSYDCDERKSLVEIEKDHDAIVLEYLSKWCRPINEEANTLSTMFKESGYSIEFTYSHSDKRLEEIAARLASYSR